jgi:hypothetical protein
MWTWKWYARSSRRSGIRRGRSRQEERRRGMMRLRSRIKILWCPGAGSNHRHCDFQSHALPTELPGQVPARAAGAPVYSQARRSCPPRFGYGQAWRGHARRRRSVPGVAHLGEDGPPTKIRANKLKTRRYRAGVACRSGSGPFFCSPDAAPPAGVDTSFAWGCFRYFSPGPAMPR